MGINRGKDFENQIRKKLNEIQNISVDRFPDPMAGYKGIRNICDFGVYKYPIFCYLECKAIHGNTLNFKGHITKDQWDGMLEKSKIQGVVAGIIVWFIEHDTTAFIRIENLHQLSAKGNKSLNIKDIKENKVPYILIEGEKKRVFYDYDMNHFINILIRNQTSFD